MRTAFFRVLAIQLRLKRLSDQVPAAGVEKTLEKHGKWTDAMSRREPHAGLDFAK